MESHLFHIDILEFIKGISIPAWMVIKLIFVPFWKLWVFLLVFEIFNLLFNRFLPKRRIYSSASARHIPEEVRNVVWDRDGGRCVKCGKRGFGAEIHFDHIIPFSKGGSSNIAENIQILCKECNLKKSDKIGSN